MLSLEHFQEDMTAGIRGWKRASKYFRVADNKAQGGTQACLSVSLCLEGDPVCEVEMFITDSFGINLDTYCESTP